MKDSGNRTITKDNFGAWLIKCDPKVWDLVTAMDEGLPSITDWSVADNYRSEMMEEGDPVVFWVSGSTGKLPKAGVWGVGVLSSPRYWESESEDITGTYWTDSDRGNAAGYGVATDIRLITNEDFREKVSRDRLKKIKTFRDMEVIRQPQMANPNFLTKSEFAHLQKLIPEWSASKVAPRTTISVGKTGAGFGNAATNAIVEERAMQSVMKYYRKLKYKATDVSSKNLGWDITVTRAGVKETLHIEVKGVSGQIPRVLLTSNEMRNAQENPLWKLAVVTGALTSKPKVVIWPAKSVANLGKPFVWQVNLKKD